MNEVYNSDLRIFESKESPCANCTMFDAHGDDCWFYWEHKSDCSQKE